jgi:hypothetical protein
MNITIRGIRAQTSVTYYSRAAAAIGNYPAEPAAIGFRVLDTDGQPAPWLQAKMTPGQVRRIEAELLRGVTGA